MTEECKHRRGYNEITIYDVKYVIIICMDCKEILQTYIYKHIKNWCSEGLCPFYDKYKDHKYKEGEKRE